jgi:hypothetical protein
MLEGMAQLRAAIDAFLCPPDDAGHIPFDAGGKVGSCGSRIALSRSRDPSRTISTFTRGIATPQPHGFESLLRLLLEADTDDLAITNRKIRWRSEPAALGE